MRDMLDHPEPMADDVLVTILKAEDADASLFHQSEIAQQQADALDRYFGKPYGDEKPGRSKIVSKDIEDTVNWMLPDLMRVFMASDELVTVDGSAPEDEAPSDPNNQGSDSITKLAADYLDHILFKDNQGATLIHDCAFDGLVQKTGIVSTSWEDPQAKPPVEYEGLTQEQVVKFATDPEYRILGQEQDGDRWALKVVHTPRRGRVVIECVPPEEFAISRRAKDIKTADYHRRKREVFLADILRLFPDARGRLTASHSDGTADGKEDASDADLRLQARHPDEAVNVRRPDQANNNRKKVDLLEEYIRLDGDGDGIVELRCVKRIGDVILENYAVPESCFTMWSPVRISHRAIGRSVADLLIDLQKIRTVLSRRALDGLAQALTPRKVANTAALGEQGMDALLDNDIGGVIPVTGDVRSVIMDLVTPDVSASAFQALEYYDGKVEQASGVTRHSQGMDPSAVNKTATGIELLQAAAKVRVEMVARWLGIALEDVMGKALRLICVHQDHARQIKIKGRWVAMDPRRWNDEMAVSLHVGMSNASRAAQVSNLTMILAKQEQIIGTQGPSNPICGVHQYRNTLGRLAEAMGYKDPVRFFKDIPADFQPPQPQPDPKAAEAQAKLQMEQQRLQMDMQAAQQRAQLDQQTAERASQLAQAEAQHKVQLAEIEAQSRQKIAHDKAQNDVTLAANKAEIERQIAQMKIEAESEIAREQMAAEMALAREKMAMEMEISRHRAHLDHESKKHATNVKASLGDGDGDEKISSGVRMGGVVG
jgi:hypothetical protein